MTGGSWHKAAEDAAFFPYSYIIYALLSDKRDLGEKEVSYMYKCRDCAGDFEEPEVFFESRPVGRESFSVCPYCGSFCYGEAGTEGI